MKKLFLSILLAVLFSSNAMADVSSTFKYGDYVDGEVLVLIDSPASSDFTVMGKFNRNVYSQVVKSQAEAFTRSFGFESCSTFPDIASYTGKSIIHIRSENKSTIELIREISSDPNVIVEPCYVYKKSITPIDPYYVNGYLWGMQAIRMPQVWNYVTGSNSVYVAVIDSGIDYTHDDLKRTFKRINSFKAL
jgi:hypothetical protein